MGYLLFPGEYRSSDKRNAPKTAIFAFSNYVLWLR